MYIQAEISYYPIGEADPAPVIERFIGRLETDGLTVEIGTMSTTVTGPSAAVFEALRNAFESTPTLGHRVMVVKVLAGPVRGTERGN